MNADLIPIHGLHQQHQYPFQCLHQQAMNPIPPQFQSQGPMPMQQLMNSNIFEDQQRRYQLNRGRGFKLIRFDTPSEQTLKDGDEEEKEQNTDCKELKSAAVIITICDCSTFDILLISVKLQQSAWSGNRVSINSCSQRRHIQDLKAQIIRFDAEKMRKRQFNEMMDIPFDVVHRQTISAFKSKPLRRSLPLL